MSPTARLSLVDRADPRLSIVAQCGMLRVARSTLYYRPAPVSPDDLQVMRRMDEQYLATPFYGARRMVAVLRRGGHAVNRKRVRRLMHRCVACVLQRRASAPGLGLPHAARNFRGHAGLWICGQRKAR